MRLPRRLLLISWSALTALSYYLLLFTFWGNYFHGGGPLDAALLDAFIVLGAFLSLEVFRTEKGIALRVTSALVGAPLALFVVLALWFALKRYVAV